MLYRHRNLAWMQPARVHERAFLINCMRVNSVWYCNSSSRKGIRCTPISSCVHRTYIRYLSTIEFPRAFDPFLLKYIIYILFIVQSILILGFSSLLIAPIVQERSNISLVFEAPWMTKKILKILNWFYYNGKD